MLRLLFVLLLLPTFAIAEEKVPTTYGPEYCEFEVTFPGAPYTAKRCEEELSSDRCFELVSYTHVYEMSSTVNFRVICNSIGEEVFKEYSPEVMEATLRAMTKQSVVEEFNSSFRENEKYKQAGLVGEGLVGRTPTIYIAQLWIGQNSALSVEAELIGEPMEDADTLFRDVLQSVRHKDDAPEEEPEEEPQEDDSD